MPNFDQETPQAVSELHHIIQTGKIPNAFLFTGEGESGKQRAAFEFAKALNCRADGDAAEKPCHSCPQCRKIDGRLHPDMIIISQPEKKKEISISRIREMESLLSTRPNEAAKRMILISQAQRMNIQAQNALLKVLEEPPENTFFILTAPGTAGLVDTIISRCRQIRFAPVPVHVIAQQLVSRHGIDPQMARIASRTAGSDMDKAMMLVNLAPLGDDKGPEDAEKADWQTRRTWIVQRLFGLILPGTASPMEQSLFLSEKLSREPDCLPDWFLIMGSFFRDLAVFRYHPEKIVNLDFFTEFQDINQKISHQTFLDFMEDFFETEKRLASNSSIRLTLDRFFLKISAL